MILTSNLLESLTFNKGNVVRGKGKDFGNTGYHTGNRHNLCSMVKEKEWSICVQAIQPLQ